MKLGDKYDVIVAGGGPAGIVAAVSTTRQGAKTTLVERYGILDGMLTSGYVNPILGLVSPGTIKDEVVALLKAASNETHNRNELSVNTEEAKHLLLKFVVDSGVDVSGQCFSYVFKRFQYRVAFFTPVSSVISLIECCPIP